MQRNGWNRRIRKGEGKGCYFPSKSVTVKYAQHSKIPTDHWNKFWEQNEKSKDLFEIQKKWDHGGITAVCNKHLWRDEHYFSEKKNRQKEENVAWRINCSSRGQESHHNFRTRTSKVNNKLRHNYVSFLKVVLLKRFHD